MIERRAGRGDSLRELADRVRAQLTEAVPAAIRAATVRGRCYCLVLSHGESLFPLTLILGREEDRQVILASRGLAAKHYLYTPSAPAITLDDLAGASDYALLDEGIARQNAWDLGRRTLQQAARQLNERSWTGVLDVTDDFVVLALDYEADELAESLEACVPAAKLAALRDRGLA